MPDIRFHCPNCQGKLVVDARAMGRDVPCPDCKQMLTIPLRSEDPVKPAQSSKPEVPASTAASGNNCTRCGKKIISDTYEVASQCRDAGMNLNWGSVGPTLTDGGDTATGLNDIYDVVARNSDEKAASLQSIIGSWAPHGRCPKCGEQWCQQCIKGRLPYVNMRPSPSCKCG
jgi:predicted RNA-binding Zn-ribbon protein involved in translation (DUF1610 family)